MNVKRRRLLFLLLLLLVTMALWLLSGDFLPRPFRPAPGAALDSLHGVTVHYNGGMGSVHGRNTVDGYNVGLRYQCVEFVKRYYLEHFGHRMPDSYGHARDFFLPGVGDGGTNTARGLVQFTNPSSTRPAVGDLVVFDAGTGNRYGHVAIVSAVHDREVEVIQQNTSSTRSTYDLDRIKDSWWIDDRRILGRLRMP